MKMFYGYNRNPKDAPDGCEKVWLDDATTKRQERSDMILSLRDGDAVVLLVRSDLGRGAEIKALEAAIQSAGASLVIDAPEAIPQPRGAPKKYDPTPEQDRKIENLYHGYLVASYVLDRARAIAGDHVEWHHLKRRYGNRWINSKEAKDGD